MNKKRFEFASFFFFLVFAFSVFLIWHLREREVGRGNVLQAANYFFIAKQAYVNFGS